MIALAQALSTSPLRAYAQNVGSAARALGAALLAVRPQHDKLPDVAELYQMANQYQSLMPNLSAELRSIAARA